MPKDAAIGIRDDEITVTLKASSTRRRAYTPKDFIA
jgi:hypothetical protein